jgi:hypothetical protein
MASVTEFLEKRLRLNVNREKSAVARPWERKFLGYSMTWHKQPRLKVAESSIKRLKEKVRRRLRCLIWLRWKRPKTRAKELIKRGLEKLRAWKSAGNGRGSWWNAGASHMNEAFPKSFFDRSGLVSLLDQQRKFQFST